MGLLIIGFEKSPNNTSVLTWRSVAIISGFTIFWMLAWSFLSYTTNKVEALTKKLNSFVSFVTTTFFVLIISIVSAILFNYLYDVVDVHIFGMGDIWEQTPFPHPELVYPLILISLMTFFIDRSILFESNLKNAELIATKLKQENIQARYDALKNQIDPHFFFNSLSTLSSIITTAPDLSLKYIVNLSKLYRNTLEEKQNNIVTLRDEIEVLHSYIFLIKIRYPNCLDFRIEIDNETTDTIGIHTQSLQILVENAIKHNFFKEDNPLNIFIYLENRHICVKNQIREKRILEDSTKIGLKNIRERYALQGMKIITEIIDNHFIVRLPVIALSHNGNSDN